jgi:hypothetical protein
VTVKQELASIAQRHGGVLRPKDVVAFARNCKTALHARFCWDNDAAAELYRLEQAREIIRTVIVVVESNKGPVTVRAYTSLQPDRKAGDSYRLTTDLLSDAATRATLLAQALVELEAWRFRYGTFCELARVYDAIDAARQPVKRRTRATG